MIHTDNIWGSAPNPAGAAPLRPALNQNLAKKENQNLIVPPVGRAAAIINSERKSLLKWGAIG